MSATPLEPPRSAFISARPSTDMGHQNLYQRKPTWASCNWVKEQLSAGAPYTWWRRSGTTSCSWSTHLFIGGSAASDHGTSIVPPSGAWWAGNVGGYYNGVSAATCGSVNGYITSTNRASTVINVMQALQDAVWTSSVSFSVYLTGPFSQTLNVRPWLPSGGVGGGTPDVSSSAAATTSVACGAGTMKTVTVYDDGRITIT